MAAVQGRVDLSTVTLRLSRAPPVTAMSPPGFLDGLSGGWSALPGAGRVATMAVGAILPFVPLAVGAALLARWARRRRVVRGPAAAA